MEAQHMARALQLPFRAATCQATALTGITTGMRLMFAETKAQTAQAIMYAWMPALLRMMLAR